MNIQGVLFDFDGVLADTMETNFACWRDAFLKYGYELSARRFFLMEGAGAHMIAQHFLKEVTFEPKPDWKEIAELKNQYFIERYTFQTFPGTDAVLNFLESKGIGRAIVTGADGERMKKTVPETFLKRFGGVVTLFDVEKPKPYPDPYRKGAELIGVPPENCVVVENAPAGLQAGKKAGSFTIGLTTTLTAEDLKEADLVLKNHFELLEWLKENIA